MEARTLSFSVNGSFEAPNGIAFEAIVHHAGGIFPAFTAGGGIQVQYNFGDAGDEPFKFAPPSPDFVAVSECT